MLELGQQIYFKRDTDCRTRKGQIVGGNDLDGWQIQGRRQADRFAADVYHLTTDQIQTEEAFKASRSRSTIHETISTHGRQITATEMNRRAQVAADRLQLTEIQILQARAMLEIRRRTVRELAHKNRIPSTICDYDYNELDSEYVVAQLTALRATASSASDDDIRKFKQFLAGETTDSRMIMTITRTARTAAIRFLKSRTQYRQFHTNIDDVAYYLAA